MSAYVARTARGDNEINASGDTNIIDRKDGRNQRHIAEYKARQVFASAPEKNRGH